MNSYVNASYIQYVHDSAWLIFRSLESVGMRGVAIQLAINNREIFICENRDFALI